MNMGDITFGMDTSGNPIMTQDGVNLIAPPCMPSTFVGPLQVGQTYCPDSTTPPIFGGSPAACPAGSTCSIVPGIPNTTIYIAVAAVVSVFFVAMAFGGHHR